MNARVPLILALVVVTLVLACDAGTRPGAATATGELRGEVHYAGASTAPLKLVVFPSFPPRGAPIAWQEFSHPVFPQPFALQGVPPGRYFVLAILDADPTDGDGFRPARDSGGAYGGFASPIAVTVDGAAAAEGLRIDLVDPGAGSPWSRLNYR